MTKLTILNVLIIVLAVVLVVVYSYTIPGHYRAKTEVYNQILDMEDKCNREGNTFNYSTLTCEQGGGYAF